MAVETDAALIARARRGDAAALEVLVRRYLRPAYAVALSIVKNETDAEDLAQEALVVAFERLDQCREPARFAPWLFQGVRHRALNHLEQSKTRAALLDQVVERSAQEVDPAQIVVRRRLLAALEKLSPIQREVVLLHDLQTWTHAEIASALDISEVMSRQHLFMARRILRAHLAQDSQDSLQENAHE
jgi:RNA polymerase sigma-70 factor (ECF subfamily)